MKTIKKKIIDRLNNSQRIFVTAHRNADADAAASVYFIVKYLEKKGKDVKWDISGETPEKFQLLLDEIDQLRGRDEDTDLAFYMDSTSPERTEILPSGSEFIINIDHHPSNGKFGDVNAVYPEMSSTSEIIHHIFEREDWNAEKSMREALILGIMGDTGCLRYDNTAPDTLNAVRDLMGDDINIFSVYKKFFMSRTLDQFKFLGEMANRIESYRDHVFYLPLDFITISSSSLKYDEISDLFNFFRTLNDAHVLILLREIKPGKVRINFRGNNGINLNEIATKFGGGGHVNAAACYLEGEMKDVTERILRELDKYL